MDAALIKPSKVRRVVKIQPPIDELVRQVDVTSNGSLVEVADPRQLRPRDFRTDFVYGPRETTDDIAQCDLPPLLEGALSGTDAVLVVAGPDGSGQADLIDAPNGLGVHAAKRLFAELQDRQVRHRQDGGGGYSFQLKLQCFQVVGDRIEDLLTERPEPARLADTANGAVVEGLRAASISSIRDVVEEIQAAQRRRDPSHRARSAGALVLEVTQADYWAGWGLFGRVLVLEAPALDCLAEDRGLVQLRDGFDTFRGIYHLRNLVRAWTALSMGDVTATTLTWLLKDVLCGGSVSATFLLCLGQGQAALSTAALEFLDDLGKVETNPVCCDHRVTGFARALRLDCLQARRALAAAHVGSGGDREGEEDMRRIILELERRLRAAERSRDESSAREGQALSFQDRYTGAMEGQEHMQNQLIEAEEERIKMCQGLVEMQLQNLEIKDEMSENQYKDDMMLMVLEQEVADLQTAMRQHEDEAGELESELGSAVGECADFDGQLGELRAAAGGHGQAVAELEEVREHAKLEEVECGKLQNSLVAMEIETQREALDIERSRGEATASAEDTQRELRTRRRKEKELQEQLQLVRVAEQQARDARDASDSELSRLQEEFRRSLGELAAPATTPDGVAVDKDAVVDEKLSELARMSAERERCFLVERQKLEMQVRELQERLTWAAHVALDWAPERGADDDKAKLHGAAHDVEAQVTAAADKSTSGEQELIAQNRVLCADLELERQRLRSVQVENAKELKRRDAETARLEADVLSLRKGCGGAAAWSVGDTASTTREADLVEKNRELQVRIDQLETHTPAEQRAQLQRSAFLEKAMRKLEGERSELLVRSTVAEEQLVQLQRHLKELTEGYQMQIMNLKLQARAL